MPRPAAKDPARTKAKHTASLEAVNENIRKLQDQITQVEDLQQEGFPYRDAVRARAELQVRECIKCIFGERSPEFHQWKTHHLRTNSPSEVAETISLLHSLIAQLERKKLELQGVAPPSPSHTIAVRSASDAQPSAATVVLAVPSTPSATPAEAIPPPLPAPLVAPSQTTTSLADHPTALAEQSVVPIPPSENATLVAQPPTSLQDQGTAPREPPPSNQALAPQTAPSPASLGISQGPGVPRIPEPREQVRDSAHQGDAPAAAPGPLSAPPSPVPHAIAVAGHPPHEFTSECPANLAFLELPPSPALPARVADLTSEAAAPQAAAARSAKQVVEPPAGSASRSEDPLDLVRKVCTRFHAVVRQLRLRGNHRTPLDVQDEQDVQDLLYVLLRYEFDEVAQTEWSSGGPAEAPRAMSLLPSHHLAVLAGMTKSGIGSREIAERVTADATAFPATGHQTLFCFVYDPDGRIGNPRGLEAELTRVSDAQIVEVFIAPK